MATGNQENLSEQLPSYALLQTWLVFMFDWLENVFLSAFLFIYLFIYFILGILF